MNNQINTQKILKFYLTRILIGLLVVGGLVTFIEWSGRLLLEKSQLSSSSIGINETESQVLPVDTEDFEIAVRKVCELIKHNDSRIGRIPKPRQTRLKAKNINKSGKLFP